MNDTIVAHCDGYWHTGSINIGAWGYIIEENGYEFCNGYGVYPNASDSFFMEYVGLLKCLDRLISEGMTDEVLVITDCSALANQMNGTWLIKHKKSPYVQLHYKARTLKAKFKNIKFEWQGRENNRRADKLCQKALAEYYQKRVKYGKDN